MATLENDFDFTGSIGNMSAYRMKGSDKIILRKKGGPKRKHVRTAPNFERTRLNNAEFAGAVQAVKCLRWITFPMHKLADYNFTPQLTSLFTKIQQQDPVNRRGQRAVLISAHRDLLAGFRFNRKHPFSSVVTNPVTCVINRETRTAAVELPRLINGINLQLPWKYPAYRFTMVLGTVGDVVYKGAGYEIKPVFDQGQSAVLHTEWYVNGAPFLPKRFELQIDKPGGLQNDDTMVLSVGIQMGAPGPEGKMEAVRYAGSATILAAG